LTHLREAAGDDHALELERSLPHPPPPRTLVLDELEDPNRPDVIGFVAARAVNGALIVGRESSGRNRMRVSLVHLETDDAECVAADGMMVEKLIRCLGQKAHAAVGTRGVDQGEPDRRGRDVPARFERQVLMKGGVGTASGGFEDGVVEGEFYRSAEETTGRPQSQPVRAGLEKARFEVGGIDDFRYATGLHIGCEVVHPGPGQLVSTIEEGVKHFPYRPYLPGRYDGTIHDDESIPSKSPHFDPLDRPAPREARDHGSSPPDPVNGTQTG
jgi:hypothetical protein